jgi:hypothetical protein
MFTLYDIGKACALVAFVSGGFCFGLGIMFNAWCERAQPEPPQTDGGHVDNPAQQSFTVFDAVVAERLLEQCDL